MNKEEFLKAIENIPKTDSINPIIAYNSINVEDLANAVDRLKKVPTYDELLKENQKYKEVIDKAIEYINKYAWQEDIIGGIYTTTGKPAIDRYMQLEWDNCNELLEILKEVSE